jgi:hypothetical protein
MRKRSVLKPLVVAAGIAVLVFPSFAHSMGGSDRAGSFRAGTTGLSESPAFSLDSAAVDAIARIAKPAADYAATDTDRDLAARIRVAVEGDPSLAPLLDDSFHITVDNGMVTLLGEVRDAQAKEQITAKVEGIAGIHPVDNKLVIVQR